jgi:hypothetical protein
VNWVDLWGLKASDTGDHSERPNIQPDPQPTFFTQGQWANNFGQDFANEACAATAVLNEVSNRYTTETGQAMTQTQGTAAMQAAVNTGAISYTDANVNNWGNAANNMWNTTGQQGTFTYNGNGTHQIHAIDNNGDGRADHFVNSIGNGQYRDTANGNTGNVADLTRQAGGLGPTRGFDFSNP